MNDELGHDRVERPVRKGQTLGRSSFHLDAGQTFSSRANKLRGWVHSSHGRRAESRYQLRREGAWAAPDVEDALIARHPGEGRHQRSEQD